MPRPDYTLPLDQLPDPLPIEPLTKPFDVTITPPGSKSITCRAYVLAALAQGESRLIRPLRADDTELLLKALCALGAEARWEGDDVHIKGVNGRFPCGGSVNLGDGGTPTRFMIACACLAAEPVTVDGSKRMRERPIAEGVEMLRQLGAKIEYVEAEGRLPVRVTPSDLKGGKFEVPKLASSQFVSAMMLIAPQLPGGLELTFTEEATSASYINLTFNVLTDWDATSDDDVNCSIYDANGRFRHNDKLQVARVSPSIVRGIIFQVEPDASSAIYWCAAAALGPIGSRVTIPNLDWTCAQPDAWLLVMLDQAGAEVRSFEAIDDPRRVEVVSRGVMAAQKFSGEDSPDGSMMFAVLGAVAHGTAHICDLGTLRVKETDRIAALANELRRVGCPVKAGEDWITIDTCTRHNESVVIETYNDHRMAMAFAVLGIAAPGGRRLAIRNPACVAKSYPTFWRDFAKLYQ